MSLSNALAPNLSIAGQEFFFFHNKTSNWPNTHLESPSALKGGSFSKTLKIVRQNKYCVRKIGGVLGKEKLKREILWLLALPESIAFYFPKILEYSLDDRNVFYDMPFYEYPTLTNLLLNDCIDTNRANDLLINLLNQYFNIFTEKKTNANRQNYIQSFLIGKVLQRINLTRKLAPKVFTKIIEKPTIYINGKCYYNILPTINFIMHNKNLVKSLAPLHFSQIHGDLHFDNIMLTDRGFLFLDPRGDELGDPSYDIAKLMHTIIGKYDFLNYDLHSTRLTNKRNDKIEIVMHYDINHNAWNIYKNLENNFTNNLNKVKSFKAFAQNDKNLFKRIEFIHATLFASDMPFHIRKDENEERALAIYATGVILLNQFIQKYTQ